MKSNFNKTKQLNTKKIFFKKKRGSTLSKAELEQINYKNPELLLKFTSEGGRILPGRITGLPAQYQRWLKKAVKIARILALLPFCSHR